MILATLAQADRYARLHPGFARAFDFLRRVDGTQALGRHELDGERAFALVQTYTTKPQADALFEAHRKYIDVQFIHSGRETILWAPLASLSEPTMSYDESKDAALWKLTADSTPLHVSAGHFCILYPEDAHAPCVQWDAPAEVFKVVVKVAVE
ncbi:MAG: YhcH/YjgK/YiaL family protein [Prosthecobacter sp.]|jgi:YhcH/YjgK/YiaL family protein|nr:YhcH/YjgK/YiaL family protein [Prosthecobacter sp.]